MEQKMKERRKEGRKEKPTLITYVHIRIRDEQKEQSHID
jgi:hypothetical protein